MVDCCLGYVVEQKGVYKRELMFATNGLCMYIMMKGIVVFFIYRPPWHPSREQVRMMAPENKDGKGKKQNSSLVLEADIIN